MSATPAQRDAQAAIRRGPVRNYPTERNLFDLFQEQVCAHPHAVAISAMETKTSYAQLSARAHQICLSLQQTGIVAEQPVGVLLNRTPEMIATLLGILKAGGAYVALDPEDPPERNRRILEASGCSLVVIDPEQAAALPGSATGRGPSHTVEVLDVRDTEHVEVDSALPTAPGGTHLAYIMFTSGSTGMPKGVQVEHRSVINYLCGIRDLLAITSADRFLAATTIGFDISVTELFLPLVTGGSILLRSRELLLNPRQLVAELLENQVSIVQCGPTAWSMILSTVPDFPRLRVAITGGEAIGPLLAGKLATYADQAWNLYGPTEATVWATAHRLTDRLGASASGSSLGDDEQASLAGSTSAPIGRPLANTAAVIVDENGAGLEAGRRGELCLGGACLARGYHGQPQLTHEQFVQRPGTGERFYKTGDLAEWDIHGNLLYFGRNDDQLKIRGVRIEPREVEAAILSHPQVRAAAATWYMSTADTRSLVCGVVPVDAAALSAASLHEWVEGQLHSAMVPSRFVFYDALPLAPSGKVDRKAIRDNALRDTAIRSTGDLRAPTATEQKLIVLWKRLLKLDSVQVTDHFFSIGGDSLAAVRMLMDTESAFKIALPVALPFKSPTLEKFAARIDAFRPKETLHHEGGPFIFPLTDHTDRRPLFFHSLDLTLAAENRWKLPISLFAISEWARGQGFVRARSLPDLARIHASWIRSIQPRGPYRIAGYSFGGLVALETAQQLKLQGEEVELLFLLDPMRPQHGPAAPAPAPAFPRESVVGRSHRHLREVIRQPAHAAAYLKGKLGQRWVKNPVRHWALYHLMHLHGKHPDNRILEMLLPKNRWPAIWYSAKRLARNYAPKPYGGRTLAVFVGQGHVHEAWDQLLGENSSVHVMDGRHSDVFVDPILDQWMRLLAQEL